MEYKELKNRIKELLNERDGENEETVLERALNFLSEVEAQLTRVDTCNMLLTREEETPKSISSFLRRQRIDLIEETKEAIKEFLLCNEP